MRFIRTVAIICGFGMIQCFSVLAEEQAAQLPEDGWWIRYMTTSKSEAKNGKGRQYKIQATYSLVGTVMENDEKCRWVEVNSTFFVNGKESVILSKFLISEKDLLESEQPIDKIKRGWLRFNETNVQKVVAGNGITADNTRTIVFPGFWQKAERVDNEKTVDFKQGQLTIPTAKSLQVTPPAKDLNSRKAVQQKDVTDYTAWFDPKTSPLIAAAKIQTKTYHNDELNNTQTEEIVLEDYGTGAKSKLPDNR